MEFLKKKKRTNTHDRLLVPQHHLTKEIRKQELTTKPALDQDPVLRLPTVQSPRGGVDLVVPLTIQVFYNRCYSHVKMQLDSEVVTTQLKTIVRMYMNYVLNQFTF